MLPAYGRAAARGGYFGGYFRARSHILISSFNARFDPRR